MTYSKLQEIWLTLVVAFIIGFIAQYLKQKLDNDIKDDNIVWVSLAAGFSAVIIVGLMAEYTTIKASLLISISGIAGWSGVSLLSIVSQSFDSLVVRTAERHLGTHNYIKEVDNNARILSESISTVEPPDSNRGLMGEYVTGPDSSSDNSINESPTQSKNL